SASEQYGKVIVIMAVAVADAASVNDHRMVEQGAVAVASRFQFTKEIRELLHMIAVDFRDFIHQLGIVAMMRKPVMPFRHADLAIGAIASFPRQHERADASDVRLERKSHQIKHELGMF